MKQKITKLISVLLLVAATHLSFGQYFQRLYDVDSSYDWGWNILLQPDGNFFIEGGKQPTGSEDWGEFNMQVSADGNTILSKHIMQYNATSLFNGNPGEIKAFPGGYISPLQILQPHGTYPSGRAGLIKYDADGDTVFLKTYTDTSVYFEVMYACTVMPSGGFLGGGGRGFDTPSYFDPLLLIRTDSIGDTLWTRTYQKNDTQEAVVNNVIPLGDGRIVVGAMSTYQVLLGPPGYLTYDPKTPWFLVLDSLGNIIKDTLYGTLYGGGYIHVGEYNTLYTPDPSDIENFPGYIAHLDTNFRITWITTFSFTVSYGHRDIEVVKQLQDSSYIVIGDAQTNYPPYSLGWAAKISRTGGILWNKTYFSDSTHYAYFRDVVEKPDGGFVFVGATYNDTCPSWHDHRDMWLVSVDSNGYLPPDTSTGVHVLPPLSNGVIIYPNPTNGNFTINCPQEGEVLIYNVQGQCVANYKIKAGATSLQLPAAISPGMYICKFIPAGGGSMPAVVRLVYAP